MQIRFGALPFITPNRPAVTGRETPVRFGQSHDDQFVRVVNKPKVTHAVARKTMEPDVFDFRLHFFDEDNGRLFMLDSWGPPDFPEVTGKDLLDFLVTADAVNPYQLPRDDAWDELDFSRLGRSEHDLEQFLADRAEPTVDGGEKQIPKWLLNEVLWKARVEGLIYRLTDPRDHQVYYGVPPQVREKLGLEVKVPTEAAAPVEEKPDPDRVAFQEGLQDLLKMVQSLPKEDFRFELGTQILLLAEKEGLIELPSELTELADEMLLSKPNSYCDLLTLLEESEGTEQYGTARSLCFAAAKTGQLSIDDVAEAVTALED